MRRDDPDRHGRAADALIATYLRELLSDEQPAADAFGAPAPPTGEPLAAPTALLLPASSRPTVDAPL